MQIGLTSLFRRWNNVDRYYIVNLINHNSTLNPHWNTSRFQVESTKIVSTVFRRLPVVEPTFVKRRQNNVDGRLWRSRPEAKSIWYHVRFQRYNDVLCPLGAAEKLSTSREHVHSDNTLLEQRWCKSTVGLIQVVGSHVRNITAWAIPYYFLREFLELAFKISYF